MSPDDPPPDTSTDTAPADGPADAPAAGPTGSGLAAEKARRLAQLETLRAEGVSPYPYRFDRTHTVAEVRAGWGRLEPGVETEDAVAVAGRIMLLRDSGKLVFATIRDRSGDIQLFVSRRSSATMRSRRSSGSTSATGWA